MNKLSVAKRVQVIRCLVEGMSIRSTVRITGVAKNTISKLLLSVGDACARFHDEHVRGVACRRVQVDEVWSFVAKKQKNVQPGELLPGEIGVGDVWTWIALDAESKLMISWLVGGRDASWATGFMKDVSRRLRNRVQLTSDGHRPYLVAVDAAFKGDVDYAILVKIYGETQIAPGRYSPAVCTGAKREGITGEPEEEHISTSFVERQNLTIRMGCRRFTRLTNGFSKKLANHEAAVALHAVYYNFCRLHETTRCSPAMEAGLTDVLLDVEDIVLLAQQRLLLE